VAALLGRMGSSRAVPAFPGVSAAAAREVIVLEYGHPRSLDVIQARAKDIAAVLVEPVQSRATEVQPRAFLQALRELTQRTGSALVFDEMVTGFRVHPGGAAAHFSIRPDLATYSKIAGGGMPLSVIAGSARFMDRIDGGPWQYGDDSAPRTPTTFFAGTFTKHPLSLVAAHALLSRVKAEGPALQAGLNTRTQALVARINGFCKQSDLPLEFTSFGSFFALAGSRSRIGERARQLLAYHLLLRGVHLRVGDAGGFLSTEHGDAELDHVFTAFSDSLAALRDGELL
jgi:glutamate-1-semialdehyde aminotransferase